MISTDELSVQLNQLTYLKFLKLLKKFKINVEKFRLPERNITTRLINSKVRSLFELILGKDKYYISKQRGYFTWYIRVIENGIKDYNYKFEEYIANHPKLREMQKKYSNTYDWCNINVFEYNDGYFEINSEIIKELIKYKRFIEDLIAIRKQLYEEWQEKEEKKKEFLKRNLQQRYDAIVAKKLAEKGV